jgi:hypothetical protein
MTDFAIFVLANTLPMRATDRIIYKSLVKGTMLVACRNFAWVVVNS